MTSSLKYPLAIFFAVVVSLSLFFLMQVLIRADTNDFIHRDDRQIVNIHMPEYENELRDRIIKPEPPKKPEPAPPKPILSSQLAFALASLPEVNQFPVSPMTVNVVTELEGVGLGEAEGEYLPIVKVAPIYPYNALRSEIEGYVIVEFTVTKTGSVKDLKIVESKPKRIFNRVAKEAVVNFKYKPRIVGGEPVEVKGVKNKFTFKITR